MVNPESERRTDHSSKLRIDFNCGMALLAADSELAMKILADIKGISIIRFDDRDIIRHRLVKSIVKAYSSA